MIVTRNTATQAPVADSSRLLVNQEIAMATASAAIPATGLEVMAKIAGTVMTDSVT